MPYQNGWEQILTGVCTSAVIAIPVARAKNMEDCFSMTDTAECNAGNNEKKENFIILLKAIACLLITNSHCRGMYPVPFLAVGGSFGNAIFFLVSGYCLANIRAGFREWYQRRIRRIVPSLMLIILMDVFFVEGAETIARLSLIDICIFYVNQYWFVFAILLWYIIFYLVYHKKSILWAKTALVIYIAAYAFIYVFFVDKTRFSVEPGGFAFFKAYFYLGIMLVGGLLKLDNDCITEKVKNKKKILAVIMAAAFIFWGGVWVCNNVMHVAYNLQFFVHVWVMCFVVAFFLFIKESDVQRWSNAKVVRLISESVLEIYLVQVTFPKHVIFPKYVMIAGFPVNVMLFMILAFGGGILFCKLKDGLVLLLKGKAIRQKNG